MYITVFDYHLAPYPLKFAAEVGLQWLVWLYT